jgi:hypothetical protein
LARLRMQLVAFVCAIANYSAKVVKNIRQLL